MERGVAENVVMELIDYGKHSRPGFGCQRFYFVQKVNSRVGTYCIIGKNRERTVIVMIERKYRYAYPCAVFSSRKHQLIYIQFKKDTSRCHISKSDPLARATENEVLY